MRRGEQTGQTIFLGRVSTLRRQGPITVKVRPKTWGIIVTGCDSPSLARNDSLLPHRFSTVIDTLQPTKFSNHRLVAVICFVMMPGGTLVADEASVADQDRGQQLVRSAGQRIERHRKEDVATDHPKHKLVPAVAGLARRRCEAFL